MLDLSPAVEIICKYQGFNERAYPDHETGGAPYSIGYGTQFYPDGALVRKGHLCTKEKALEYLDYELRCIDADLDTVNLRLDASMRLALLSFIYSIGWSSFFYSDLIEYIANENWGEVAGEMSRWIFDSNYRVIGNLIDRRREEIKLFLQDVPGAPEPCSEVLLNAFQKYLATPKQIKAIQKLEENSNPYIIAEFANEFDVSEDGWLDDFQPIENELLDSQWA
jgi:GH24 family phage-related lysozyme (muramidase)